MPDENVTVQITVSATPVAVAVVTESNAAAVAITAPPAQPVSVAVETTPQPVVVAVSQGVKGDPGAAGEAGAPAEIVILTLAAYLALSPEVQMDGRWYLIPKT